MAHHNNLAELIPREESKKINELKKLNEMQKKEMEKLKREINLLEGNVEILTRGNKALLEEHNAVVAAHYEWKKDLLQKLENINSIRSSREQDAWLDFAAKAFGGFNNNTQNNNQIPRSNFPDNPSPTFYSLRSQYVDGNKRVCVYGSGSRQKTKIINLSDRCSSNF